MISEQEANDLMSKFLELKEQLKTSKDNKLKREFDAHQAKCISQFNYLISMRTAKYRAFLNYDDLNQEGFEALLKAMNNYNPKKGSFFWWAHKYIETKISRSANLHTTIRYPLKFAKNQAPKRESLLKHTELLQVNEDLFEKRQTEYVINKHVANLADKEKQIITLMYGLDGEEPKSIGAICKELNIPRSSCIKLANNSLKTIKKNLDF